MRPLGNADKALGHPIATCGFTKLGIASHSCMPSPHRRQVNIDPYRSYRSYIDPLTEGICNFAPLQKGG